MGLHTKSILVNLSISRWTARKLDRKATKEVHENNGAAKDAGRYNKRLISKEHLKEVESLAGEIRGMFYEMTLPWCDTGSRVLPIKLFSDFRKKEAEYHGKWNDAVARLVANYDVAREEARERLGDLYDINEFPAEISDKFAFDVKAYPVPDSSDFRIAGLDDEDMEEIRKSVAESIKSTEEDTLRDLYNRIKKVAHSVTDRLAEDREEGKPKIFKNSLINNISELLGILPGLNISDDENIEELGKRLSEVSKYSPEELREDEKKRKSTAEIANDILGNINSLGF